MKIGIDISINSTGICINTDTDYKFYNICKSEDVYDKKSNYRKWYSYISNCVVFKTYQNSKFADTTLGKLSKYNEVLNQFTSILSDNNITPKDTIINIEDYSYTKANTNSIIDIVTLSTLIRNYLYLNEYTINFISPKELKVTVGALAYHKTYTIDNSDIQLFKYYAKERNWYTKLDNRSFYSTDIVDPDGEKVPLNKIIVYLEHPHYENYPYLDTLKFYHPMEGTLSIFRRPNTIELNSSNGGYTVCQSCGGSMVVDCDNCESGLQTCDNCGGIGVIACNKCKGGGVVECDLCFGSGEIKNSDGEYEECYICNRTGEMNCDYCDGTGDEPCNQCNGAGEHICEKCNGTDKIECEKCY